MSSRISEQAWLIYIPLILMLLFTTNCGGSSGPVIPGNDPEIQLRKNNGTYYNAMHNWQVPWGFWDIVIDWDSQEVSINPLRHGEFQANITRFLQPPVAPVNMLTISLDKDESNFPEGYVVCDVSIHHPFPGTKFWGFDVRGIVMGSPEGEVELLNQDGYTRWWNPTEFTTVGKLFGYTEGLLAPPGPVPETVLHPYKYFADSLDADADFWVLPETRGVTRSDVPGIVTRRYELQFPLIGGAPHFRFKYAVTSSYEAPSGSAPWDLSDFPLGANQPEAYQVSVTENSSTLYCEGASSGGDLVITALIADWQKPDNPGGIMGELAALILESEDLGLPPTDVLGSSIVDSGPNINCTNFHITIPDLSPISAGFADLWITAESANVTTYAPDIPGLTGFDYPEDAVLSAYNRFRIPVSDTAPPDEDKSIKLLIPNGGEVWQAGNEYNIEWESTGPITQVKIEYSTVDGDPWNEIEPSTENDGTCEWLVPETPSQTARVRVSDATDSDVDDISDCFFFIVLPDDNIYVDDSSTSPNEYGTMSDPYKTITAAIDAAGVGQSILVDDSGNTYTESVVMTDGITLLSENWDPDDGTARASIRTPDIPGARTLNINNVDSVTVSGFNVRPAGSYDTVYVNSLVFTTVENSSNVTISNCYFNGEELPRQFYGVYVSDSSDVEICCSHFEHFHGPEPLPAPLMEYDSCIYAENTPGMYIHNVRMNDLGVNFNDSGHIVDAVYLSECDNAVIHNNLVYRIEVDSAGNGAALVTGFSLDKCESPTFYNNTVNFLDTVENFFINQAFCYFIIECPEGVFYNNIASNVTVSGWAPDGSKLGRGVQSYMYELPCDYTLTWNIDAPYFQEAYANIGCVDSQPLFIDPENGLHDIGAASDGQLGDPSIVDWDDTGAPSGDPGNTDPNTRSRMGCHGGPYGSSVGITN